MRTDKNRAYSAQSQIVLFLLSLQHRPNIIAEGGSFPTRLPFTGSKKTRPMG